MCPGWAPPAQSAALSKKWGELLLARGAQSAHTLGDDGPHGEAWKGSLALPATSKQTGTFVLEPEGDSTTSELEGDPRSRGGHNLAGNQVAASRDRG